MAKYKIALSMGLVLMMAAACERPSAVAKNEEAPAPSSRLQEPAEAPRAERRDEPVRELDGKPIWSASRRGTAEENAQRAFDRNGEAFGARNLDDFVRKAHAFVESPPPGTERVTRSNGDTMFYDPKGNVFAVSTKAGAPRTMFKPDDGAAYWEEQKTNMTRRQASAGARNRAEGG